MNNPGPLSIEITNIKAVFAGDHVLGFEFRGKKSFIDPGKIKEQETSYIVTNGHLETLPHGNHMQIDHMGRAWIGRSGTLWTKNFKKSK